MPLAEEMLRMTPLDLEAEKGRFRIRTLKTLCCHLSIYNSHISLKKINTIPGLKLSYFDDVEQAKITQKTFIWYFVKVK